MWNKEKETNWELYDKETDRTEMHNLALQFPDKVKEMGEMYDEWAMKTRVLPWSEVQRLYAEKRNKLKTN